MTAECAGTGEVDCAAALAELEGFLDGEIPADRIEEIRGHIAACYPCAERTDFERQLRALVRQGCAERAPASLVERVRACIAQTRTEGGSA